MADDSLPNDYDVIVVGTGMTECIIAAALSRIGQRVLHLDRHDYYSGDWGTFHFEAIQKWIARQKGPDKEPLQVKAPKENLLEVGEVEVPLKIDSTTVSNVAEHVFIPEELPEKDVSSVDEKKDMTDVETEQKRESSGCESTKKIQEDDKIDSDKKLEDTVDPVEKPDFDVQEESGCESVEKNQEDDKVCTDKKLEGTADPVDKPDSEIQEKSENTSCKPSTEPDDVKPTRKEWSFSEMKKKWRKFNIDLQPKILYCRGPMVELLISSDIAKYCEFKSITRVLTLIKDRLEKVPCSRADVFSSKQVSMIEKRMLMKLLTFCVEFDKHPEEYKEYENKTFDEFLAGRKLTSNVRHYVKHAIAMATSKTTRLEGLKSTQKFLQSLGRYGNTAFLWPLYGSGEMPQCFCRMCAVFGGIYCLRRTGVSLIIDKEKKCKGIIDSEGQRLNTKWVILESSYTKGDMLPREKPQSISRGIFVVDRSLQSSDSEAISLLTLPHPESDDSMINIIELSPASMACPKDTHMVHMTCKGINGPKEDFSAVINTLFQPTDSDSDVDEKPKVLWSLFFTQEDTTALPLNNHGLDGVFVVATPDAELDFDRSIQEARNIFEQICPGEEFLPRAPNPEDIIYDDDQQGPNAEGSGFEPAKETKTEETSEDTKEVDSCKVSNEEVKETKDSEKQEGSSQDIATDAMANSGSNSTASPNDSTHKTESISESESQEKKDKQNSISES